MLDLVRTVEGVSAYVRVYLLAPGSCSVKTILESCETTAAMNFISWKMACSVFPSATFLDKTAFLMKNPEVAMDATLFEYAKRDFQIGRVTFDEYKTRIHALQKCRKLHDRFSWKIQFDTSGMEGTALMLDPGRLLDYISLGRERCDFSAASEEAQHRFLDLISSKWINYYETTCMLYNGFFL